LARSVGLWREESSSRSWGVAAERRSAYKADMEVVQHWNSIAKLIAIKPTCKMSDVRNNFLTVRLFYMMDSYFLLRKPSPTPAT